MSLSIQKMVSDGTLSTIALGVQYLQRNDIYMRIAGVETPQSGAPSGYTWSFLDNNTIRVLPVVPSGVEVVVYRRTDLDAMYNIYSQNAQFDESTIDENNQQLLYIAQEYFEQGVPAQLIDSVEYVREDTTNMYYRLKLSDGKYTVEFPIPKGGAAGLEALRRTYADAGLTLVDGSFETGGVFNAATDVLLRGVNGLAYSWTGVLPKVVAPGTDPTLSASYVDASAHIAAFVTPEEFGAKHTAGVDDTTAFHLALATGKRLKLGAHTYRVNLVLTQHFDIEGQGMDRTKLVAFDKTKPVVKNMFREPLWKYPSFMSMTLEGAGTLEGVGFAFGDINNYEPGDELIGRVRMTDVFFTNFDKAIQKTSGNIGNVFTNVSTRTNNYAYWARGAAVAGADASHIMHAGSDTFFGGQVCDSKKMCFLVMDTTPGGGQWTFIGTVLQFNPGGTFMWDISGTSLTAFESTTFFNIWNEGNATAESVTIDGLSGPRTITPSSKFEQTAYGPDYCSWGKTVQHGTTSTLGRVNVWGGDRIALNLESGGPGGPFDYVDLAFSSAAFQGVAGAWLRSVRGASTGRSLSLHTGAGQSADFNMDGGATIGVAANTQVVPTTALKVQANTDVGGIVAAFVGPFSAVTKINMVDNQAYSATPAGMHLGSVSSSWRSLNAAGTINASGADYAEYMYKDTDCGTIPKGAICGVTSEGLLTDQFDKAISFVVKSTDPAYVGGDSWGHSPEPERFTPEYAAWLSTKNSLANTEACKPVQADDESDSAFAERATAWETEVARLSACVAQEPSQRDSDEWLFWEADMEAKRQQVDRIAFSGQVPCNVYGAVPGDYIVPVRNGDGSIIGQSIKEPSFEQYCKSVGQVWQVLEDGRAWIAVRVA